MPWLSASSWRRSQVSKMPRFLELCRANVFVEYFMGTAAVAVDFFVLSSSTPLLTLMPLSALCSAGAFQHKIPAELQQRHEPRRHCEHQGIGRWSISTVRHGSRLQVGSCSRLPVWLRSCSSSLEPCLAFPQSADANTHVQFGESQPVSMAH